MTAKITVTLGGGTAATDLEYTASVPFYKAGEPDSPQWSFETTFANGDDGLGEFIVDNDDGSIPKADGTRNLAAKNPVMLTEDASGTEYTLVYGRIVEKDVSRNEDYPIGDASQYRVTVQAPGDLALMKLTENWERSAESDHDRLVALQAYILNGSSSTVTRPWNTVTVTVDADHLAPNTNNVAMPAKTYSAGTSIDEIIIDCATTAGKVWGIVPHHEDGTGTHKCLLYITEDDNTTYASTVSISDDPAEIDPVADPPIIAPQWGAPRHEAGQDQIFGLVVKYGTGDDQFVYVEDPDIATNIESYDHAVDVFYDSESATAAQAEARGLAMIDYRRQEHVTHTVILKVRADHAHLIGPGMSIDIKSAAAMSGQYLGTTQTRRIASVQYEPCAPEVGEVDAFYTLTLELDRRLRRMPISKGTKPGPKPPSGSCTDVSATLAPHFIDGTTTGWGVGGNTTGFSTTGGGHGGSNTAGTASGLDINCFVEYSFSGTFAAGKRYLISLWIEAVNFSNTVPYALGVGAATGFAGPPGTPSDGVTGSIALAAGVEQLLEIEWTPSADRTGVSIRWGGVSGPTGLLIVSDGSIQECSDASAPPASDDDTGDPGD
ncbi:MAG TPA: hypothetical protein VFK56_12830, partial [Mycobacterium sp.]|nr:hypothetical protein [Mycobacterium sp.]